jgi:hypothetical protein
MIHGPQIENKYIRYALCGTVATVAVELITHVIDTLNMQAKLNVNNPVVVGNIVSQRNFIGRLSWIFRFAKLFTGV